ncbi:hypothetical protein [Sorangium sp. So ce1024]|uniref:hypothetical protein n=1 Tax=Sorangium sp. So ce1024 TaxID=3133327 RepID=UPI003F094531
MAGVLRTSGRRAAGAALGAFLCAATVGAVALAQSGGAPGAPCDDGARAASLYSEGVSAAREGRWQEAYSAYLEAWKLKQHYQIAANLARAELKLGKHRDAAEHISFFLREAEGVSEADRALARQMLDEARAHVATLTLAVSRAGATVLVDGAAVGTSPLGREVYVEPGARRIEARIEGERPAQASLALAPGASQEVELRFVERAAAEAAIPPGPRAPLRRSPAAADRGASGPNMALVAAGGAATGLAAGTAVVLTVLADRSARSGSNAAVPGADACYASGPGAPDHRRCLEVHEHRTEAARLHNISRGVFVAAGALGAATLGYALYGALRSDSGPAVTAVPVALAPGAGVSLSARW